MSMGFSAESDLLRLLFNNTAWLNMGNAGGILGSTVAGSFWLSLHTANPGGGGSQNTSEAAYGSYTRLAVNRTTGGWTVSGSGPAQAANVAAANFIAATTGTETETYLVCGRDSSGAGEILFWGLITPTSIAVSGTSGTIPSFPIGSVVCNMN